MTASLSSLPAVPARKLNAASVLPAFACFTAGTSAYALVGERKPCAKNDGGCQAKKAHEAFSLREVGQGLTSPRCIEMRRLDRTPPMRFLVQHQGGTDQSFDVDYATDLSRGGLFISTLKPLEQSSTLHVHGSEHRARSKAATPRWRSQLT